MNLFLWFRINFSWNWECFQMKAVLWNMCEIFIMDRYISKRYTTTKNTIARQYTERRQLLCQLLLVIISGENDTKAVDRVCFFFCAYLATQRETRNSRKLREKWRINSCVTLFSWHTHKLAWTKLNHSLKNGFKYICSTIIRYVVWLC